MLLAVTSADTIKPGVDRLVVELDRMIRLRLKLVAVKVLHDAPLPAGADRLLPSLAAREDLHMHHVVLLLPALFIVVYGRVEDEVTGLHFLEFQIDRQSVILIGLIPTIELETEIFAQVVHYLPDEPAAVKIQRRVVVRTALVLMVFAVVRDSEVLFSGLDKFGAELFFEVRILAALLRLLLDVVAVLHSLLLGLVEALEMGLE